VGAHLDRTTVDTALGRIGVRTAGDGDAILFWPSLLMTGDMWSAQAEHFEQCARTIADVLDGLGIERAHFVGNSWGGMIGGTFVATYPTGSARRC
jgi:3-oxoadipate enol-lactonase